MARELAEDKSLAKELEEHLNQRKIAHFLFALRCSKGISQKQISESFGCSQSRISKLENDDDDDLRLGDLKEYLDALDLSFGIMIHTKHWKAMDQVRFHAFMMRDCLRSMADLARDDEKLASEVLDAHIETLVNVVAILSESAKGLNVESKFPPIFSANFDNSTPPNISHRAGMSSDGAPPAA